MFTKHTSKCLKNAADSEPIFVLRSQDALAPGIVREWAFEARRKGLSRAKFQEAMAVAEAMEKWPHRRIPT